MILLGIVQKNCSKKKLIFSIKNFYNYQLKSVNVSNKPGKKNKDSNSELLNVGEFNI